MRKITRLVSFAFIACIFLTFPYTAKAACSNANPIVIENCKVGNPATEWDLLSPAGDSSIQGYTTDISYNVGATAVFKINTNAASYSITIYRMGYYGGMGARKIATVNPSAALPQIQPACKTDESVKLVDCGNWVNSASWKVPATAVSGIYFALIKRADTGGTNHIVFIVRNDASTSDMVFQTADETWQAYNSYGGNSLYGGFNTFDLPNRAYKVSYNRPFITRSMGAESATWVFGAEYPMVRWLEANGYNVSYMSSVDGARLGALIKNHKIFLSVGHDEYWSGERRANVQAALTAGVNMGFFSGNEVFWKTRWENSIDGKNTPYRTLVCYKESLSISGNGSEDPSATWTGTWRDLRRSPPGDAVPENALTGTLFKVNGPGADNNGTLAILVPEVDGKMRFWRNTAAATLAANTFYSLPPGTLAYEWDEDEDNGYRPAGLFHLSTVSYFLTTDFLHDYGITYGPGLATHHLTLYRAPSNALVFGAGTIQWSWGLDEVHDNPFFSPNTAPDANMRQATLNLFADMGVQAATRQAGLVAASASTDYTPPKSVIASPAANATGIRTGNPITVRGTAVDTGGGRIGGVEVSGDGGATWHPAEGRENWTYEWTPKLVGTTTLKSRAVDDSGNLEVPAAGNAIAVTVRVCPCTIFPQGSIPTTVSFDDTSSIEAGVRIRTTQAGYISSIRFYKGPGNTGSHVGKLWSGTGTLLASAAFTNETASGWQQVNFAAPVKVTANTTYVATYLAPNGHYAADVGYFLSDAGSAPIIASADTGANGSNGVFAVTATGAFPNLTYNSTNYWVDVVFVPNLSAGPLGAAQTYQMVANTALSVTAPGLLQNAINWNNGTVTAGLYTNPAHGAAAVEPAGAFTYTPTANFVGTDKFTYKANNGSALSAATYVTITINKACPCMLWNVTDMPSLAAAPGSGAVTIGTKFMTGVSGYAKGIRFYKPNASSQKYTAAVWSLGGILLKSVTATLSGTGWKQMNLAAAVPLLANTPYIVSYFSPDGAYGYTSGYFYNSLTNGVLQAPDTFAVNGNGVYAYGTASVFPAQSYGATNYWVDVVYSPTP